MWDSPPPFVSPSSSPLIEKRTELVIEIDKGIDKGIEIDKGIVIDKEIEIVIEVKKNKNGNRIRKRDYSKIFIRFCAIAIVNSQGKKIKPTRGASTVTYQIHRYSLIQIASIILSYTFSCFIIKVQDLHWLEVEFKIPNSQISKCWIWYRIRQNDDEKLQIENGWGSFSRKLHVQSQS